MSLLAGNSTRFQVASQGSFLCSLEYSGWMCHGFWDSESSHFWQVSLFSHSSSATPIPLVIPQWHLTSIIYLLFSQQLIQPTWLAPACFFSCQDAWKEPMERNWGPLKNLTIVNSTSSCCGAFRPAGFGPHWGFCLIPYEAQMSYPCWELV